MAIKGLSYGKTIWAFEERPVSSAKLNQWDDRIEGALEAIFLLLTERLRQTTGQILAVDGVVAKDGSAWAATGEPYVHDDAKWDSLAATRRGEADLMRRYAHGRGCLMAFLQQALDGRLKFRAAR